MTTTAAKVENEAAPEVIPPLPDDAQGEAAPAVTAADIARAEQETRSEDGDSAPPAGLEHVRDEGRERATQRFRELRALRGSPQQHPHVASSAAPTQPPAETAETASASESNPSQNTQTPPAQEQSEAEPAVVPAASPGTQPTEITLLVDGKPKIVSLEEATRLAQIGAAGDNRLEVAKQRAAEATRLLEEAKAVHANALRGHAAPEHPPSSQPPATDSTDPNTRTRTAPEHRPAGAVDPEKLKGIAQKLQVGNEEEGAEALAELSSMLGHNQVDAQMVSRMVQEHLDRTAQRTEMNAALKRFQGDYPEIAGNRALQEAGLTMVAMEIEQDLEAAGIRPEELTPVRGNLKLLLQAQKNLRESGYQVRGYDELLSATGKKMVTEFKLRPQPTPAPTPALTPSTPAPPVRPSNAALIQQRTAAKRAAPTQPRSSGVRNPIPTAPPPKTKRDLVNEARKARGYQVTG